MMAIVQLCYMSVKLNLSAYSICFRLLWTTLTCHVHALVAFNRSKCFVSLNFGAVGMYMYILKKSLQLVEHPYIQI